MKSLLLILFLPFSNAHISYRQLSWEDFKGSPPPNTEASACTCTNIVIGVDTAYAIFIPDRSWTKTNDPEVLRHEQLHFAITQFCSFIITKQLKSLNKDIDVHLRMWRRLENSYDKETNHGQDTIAQRRWEQSIKL